MKREVHGLILLDKPLYLSSNSALQQVKRLFAAQKAGHTGSLDPLATGMLPICLGEATKFSQFLLDADKYYSVTAQLGCKTTTGDAEGEIISAKEVGELSIADIQLVLAKFRGKMQQIPSMFSALKHHGKPLYKLARQGKEVERQPRDIEIYQLEMIAYHEAPDNDLDKELQNQQELLPDSLPTKKMTGPQLILSVHCSKGTYIRNLVEDIGDTLGCGAYVQSLRRTAVGLFTSDQMISLNTLKEKFEREGYSAIDEYILPITAMLENVSTLNVTQEMAILLQYGQSINIENTTDIGLVKIMVNTEHFMGVGEILEGGHVVARRLMKI